jgi:hypothetical protein
VFQFPNATTRPTPPSPHVPAPLHLSRRRVRGAKQQAPSLDDVLCACRRRPCSRHPTPPPTTPEAMATLPSPQPQPPQPVGAPRPKPRNPFYGRECPADVENFPELSGLFSDLGACGSARGRGSKPAMVLGSLLSSAASVASDSESDLAAGGALEAESTTWAESLVRCVWVWGSWLGLHACGGWGGGQARGEDGPRAACHGIPNTTQTAGPTRAQDPPPPLRHPPTTEAWPPPPLPSPPLAHLHVARMIRCTTWSGQRPRRGWRTTRPGVTHISKQAALPTASC